MRMISILLLSVLFVGNAYADSRYTQVFTRLGSEFDLIEEAYDGLGYGSLIVENDSILGTDSNYTHGTFMSGGTDTAEVYCRKKVLGRNSFVHISDWDKGKEKGCDVEDQYVRSQTTTFGSEIHTPEDISVLPVNLGENYKPYAGWTYLEREVEYRSESGKFKKYSFSAGCIGPCAAADRQQRFVHELLDDSSDPVGWDQQITNDIALQYQYSGSIWEPFFKNKKSIEIVTYWFNSIGTVKTNIGAGLRGELHFSFGRKDIRTERSDFVEKVIAENKKVDAQNNVNSVKQTGPTRSTSQKMIGDDKFLWIFERDNLKVQEESKEFNALNINRAPEPTLNYLNVTRDVIDLKLFVDYSVAFNFYDALLEGGLFGGTQYHIVEPTPFPKRLEFGASFDFPIGSSRSIKLKWSRVIKDHDVWAKAKEHETMIWDSFWIKYSHKFFKTI